METFLSIIFWVLVIYYLIKLIVRYLFPFLLVRFINRMQNKMGGFQAQAENASREGEVKVKYNPETNTKSNSDLGEYIDFEEIKDNPNP
jgi:bacteriorhodopsin